MTTTAPVTGPCAACDYTCNTRCGCPCGCPDPYAWLSDPDDTRIQTALTRSCDLCGAKKHQWCRNTVKPDQPLPGRLVHHGRLIDRTREQKGDK